MSRGHSRHSGSGPGRHRAPAASPAALAFLDEVVTTTPAHSCGRIAMTQAELARRTGRSAGTVAYYLAQAGPDVVTKRRGGVVVDVHALGAARAEVGRRRRRRDEVADILADTWGMPLDAGGVELLTEAGSPPTLADIADQLGVARSTAQRHVAELDAQGRLRRRGGRLFLDLA
ncbi:MAG: helix-turn-helix domain-containing protein, partial [Actinomycetota bacterium]|nr:helix-turn-helix domain-containing protein [Actinomycetota bacterium]